MEPENYTEAVLKLGQKVAGECLWLAFRTRPDLVYVINFIASMVSKRPCFVQRVGLKVLAYLSSTPGIQLKVDSRSRADQAASSPESHTLTRKLLNPKP